MTVKKQRRTFSAQFKAKVGLEAIRGVHTLNEIGQQYNVHPVVVGQWKKALVDQASSVFDQKRGPKTEPFQDVDMLYSEIGRLKMELDWLKKKSGL